MHVVQLAADGSAASDCSLHRQAVAQSHTNCCGALSLVEVSKHCQHQACAPFIQAGSGGGGGGSTAADSNGNHDFGGALESSHSAVFGGSGGGSFGGSGGGFGGGFGNAPVENGNTSTPAAVSCSLPSSGLQS